MTQDIRDYASFDDATAKLQRAMKADKALYWFDGCSSRDDAVTVSAKVNHGSATAGADEANVYLKQAVQELSPQIIERAKQLLQADRQRGFVLLGKEKA